MKRKSLKQKLRSQLRQAKSHLAVEHEQAGITINYELAKMQSIALAHGVMATMLHSKQVLGEESEQFKLIQETAQARIAQCVVALVGMGVPADEANHRIIQGH